ncbi:hypothetical protein ACAG25_16255 [Mycobacterium sp. pV006]|uniref:hypothetical protein n=1 Tax=Mycobacterium sp. pV006 TaxID=3238983 RepID=UPI00351AD783
MMTDNRYPVDSTYYPCCNAIGRHAPDCSTVQAANAPQILNDAVNRIDVIRADANTVLHSITKSAPLFATVDLVVGLGHLRQAALLLDGVADALESEAVRR